MSVGVGLAGGRTETEGREPNATYFGSGRARALRSSTAISNVYRAARAAPLQKNNYLGIKVGGGGRSWGW